MMWAICQQRAQRRLGAVAAGLTSIRASGSREDELSVEDFSFEGPLGSQGTTLRRLGRNHFIATLGAAPGHPEWGNKLQFTIERHARGNALQLDVEFPSPAMSLNEYFASYSYDGAASHRAWSLYVPTSIQTCPKIHTIIASFF